MSVIDRLRHLPGWIRRRLGGVFATAPAPQPHVGEPRPQFAPRPVTRFDGKMPVLSKLTTPQRTKISFVVVVYDMPEQARRTLYSLSTDYQRGVEADDYEVIVVENHSRRLLGAQAATAYPGNFRYLLRHEKLPTPVFAINDAAALATGTHITVMIDGARMVTPGIVNYMRTAVGLDPNAVVAVPGYHLGHELQQRAVLNGYDEARESELLQSIGWPGDGYRLFEVGCLSGSCMTGFFSPIGESNCICVPREMFRAMEGFDARFTETGGGQVNLDFYKRAVERPESKLVILLGEGNFHQLHGGVTTESKGEERHRAMQAHFAQYHHLRGESYCPPDKRPIFFGTVPDAALKFIRYGADNVIRINGL